MLNLSKASNSFDGSEIAIAPVTDDIDVVGYLKTYKGQTYVGIITNDTTATTEGGQVIYNPPLPANYGITGITSGITVSVTDNGTSGTKLHVTASSALTQSNGTLYIPVSIYLDSDNDQPLGDDIVVWETNRDRCMSIVLEYSWSVSTNATSAYVLDLSNEGASVNCDADGHIYQESIQYLSCTAKLYYGIEPVTSGVTYAIVVPQSRSAVGFGIDSQTGIMSFGNNLAFEGSPIEIQVTATYKGNVVGRKVFTLAKAFPGADGQPATSYWLVLSADAVHVNVNTTPYVITPSSITATAMMQVGNQAATTATGVTIYYGFNTTSPATVYSSPVSVDVTKDTLSFSLKKGSVIVDGVETVPILKDGTNGSNGQSAYRLDLTNQACTINCDANGNILSGAVRPTCTAKLYLGTTLVTGVTYSISNKSLATSGLTINASTGVLTFNAGTAATPFNFTGGSTLEITVQAKIGSVLYGEAIMSVGKSYAGSNGNDAVSYWLSLSADAIQITTGGTANPATITATAYKQVGENTPIVATDCTIKYGYNTPSPSTTYSSAITVDKTKNYINFALYKGSTLVDGMETVPILHDGANGQPGGQGRQGAAVRGPVKWTDQTTTRRFCNGTLTNASYPEDALWIDVILRTENNVDKYYYCNTSYNGSCNDSWSTVSSKWTLADQQFNFIATKLLLAQNAAIDFLTGNEIYLRDNNGNITAGAAGGNGISFWAGDDTPSNAPFQVNADGSIKATSGTFSGYVQMPYSFVSDLSHSGTTSNGYYIADNRAYLIADGYGAAYGDYETTYLRLPAPSEEYNGFTYHILTKSIIAVKSSSEAKALSVVTPNTLNLTTNDFILYTFLGTSDNEYAKLTTYGGHIVVTCIPFHASNGVVYKWVCTDATGGVDCGKIIPFRFGGGGGSNTWDDDVTDTRAVLTKKSGSSGGSRSVGFTAPSNTQVRYTFAGNTNSSTITLTIKRGTTVLTTVTYSGSAGKTGTFTAPSASENYQFYCEHSGSAPSTNVTVTFEKISGTTKVEPIVFYNPVCGVSTVDANNAISRIYAETDVESMSKENNALYIKRNS
jgi:hypothetical protein